MKTQGILFILRIGESDVSFASDISSRSERQGYSL